MKDRCSNPNNHSFNDYGGRGITFIERWNVFENFLEDMGDAPKGMTLDRRLNNLGYSKDNCRWATSTEQNRNKRNCVHITYEGVTRLAVEWSEIYSIPYKTIMDRVYKGLQGSELFAPVQTEKRNKLYKGTPQIGKTK
jgi:hypothetical protein